MRLRVLHLLTEPSWRGGENQVFQLCQASAAEITSHFAAAPDSAAYKRMAAEWPHLALSMRPVALPWTAWRLAQYCRTQNIQLLDAHSSRAHSLGLLIKRLQPKLRLVVHRRVDYPPGSGWGHRRKYFAPGVDRYVAISGAIQQVLIDYGLPRERVSLVRSAVPVVVTTTADRASARQSLCAELSLNPALPIIVNVGYLTSQKGHATLLDGLAYLRAQGLGFHCLLAGDGPLRASLEARAQALGLGQEPRFLGIRSDILRILRGADIFAFPSAAEGLGTSLLDAIQAGCVPVATAVGGIPEIITNELSGLLSPKGDGPGFGRNLQRAITEPQAAAAWVKAARAHVARDFSVTAMAAGNIAVYRSLFRS